MLAGRLRPVKRGPGHAGRRLATFHSGGGGLLSTAADFARFAQMLRNGGELDGARILSRKMVELMLADHVADLDPHPGGGTTAVGYGLQVVRSLNGRVTPASVGSFGFGGAYGTSFFADPEERLVGVFMTQVVGGGGASRAAQTFRAVVYQMLAEEAVLRH
jgi:CubicO group peptidase (beta-lactamase class C family)